MAAARQTLLCDICCKQSKTNIAIGLCKECRELYCIACVQQHGTFKATKTHQVVIFDSAEEASVYVKCDVCRVTGSEAIQAAYFCSECRELYCNSCKQNHLTLKATSDHDLYKLYSGTTQQTVPLGSINLSSEFEGLSISADKDSGSRSSSGKLSVSTSTPDKVFGSRPSSDKVGIDSVNYTSDFEGFSIPSDKVSGQISASARVKDRIDSVIKSSDFEGFKTGWTDAQFPVFTSNKIYLNKEDMHKISAKVVDSFSAKVTIDNLKTLFNFKIKGDGDDCWFTGITCLQDGRLLLLDCLNKKLKMFDKHLNIICTEQTEGEGWGMTKVSEEEIAVLTENTIYFYRVTKDTFVLQSKKFQIDADGWGISYNRGIYAVVCDLLGSTHKIKIYSETGKELHSITSFKYQPGSIINLDTEDDRIYVSSKHSNKFSCISQQGQLLWQMDFDGGDVVELYNCLLVTDWSNDTVVLCTKDGSYRRTLIQDRKHLYGAKYMTYNADTQQLFVTRTDSSKITVIQLTLNK